MCFVKKFVYRRSFSLITKILCGEASLIGLVWIEFVSFKCRLLFPLCVCVRGREQERERLNSWEFFMSDS